MNFWFRFVFILFCQFLLLLLLLCFPIQVFHYSLEEDKAVYDFHRKINELFIWVIEPTVRIQQTRRVALAVAVPVRVRVRMRMLCRCAARPRHLS